MQLLQNHMEQGKKVFVFLGEAGSGKSEIAVNWALLIAGQEKPVWFFDMDQTKPVFRSRQVAHFLQESGVAMDDYRQFLDSPTIPNGVLDKISNPDMYTILDVGGNAVGARMLGQLAEAWGEKVATYLVINCYRPFSGRQKYLIETIDEIVTAARVEHVGVISNPNFGEQTTLQDVANGHKELMAILRGSRYDPELLVVPRRLVTEVQHAIPGIDVLGITRYIKGPWETSKEEEDRHG